MIVRFTSCTEVSQDLQGRDESGQDVADQGSAFAGIDHLTKSASHASTFPF